MAENNYDELFNSDVVDVDGKKIGSIGQVYLDDQTGQPSWVTVKTGWFGLKETSVPLEQAVIADGTITVPYSEDKVKDAPRVDPDKHLDADEEAQLYSYYGIATVLDGDDELVDDEVVAEDAPVVVADDQAVVDDEVVVADDAPVAVADDQDVVVDESRIAADDALAAENAEFIAEDAPAVDAVAGEPVDEVVVPEQETTEVAAEDLPVVPAEDESIEEAAAPVIDESTDPQAAPIVDEQLDADAAPTNPDETAPERVEGIDLYGEVKGIPQP